MGYYLIDSNVISDYFANLFETKNADFISDVLNNNPIISFVTQIELLSWKTSEKIENGIKFFIDECEIKSINADIINHCVKLRRINKLKTPDAIIAVTALAFNLRIITNNTNDFSNIKDLKIINPYQL